MIRVYLASALGRCVHTCMVASGLCREFDIVSTWHRRAKPKDKDPRDDAERAAVLTDNLADIERCDVLVALLDDGEPKATWAELGYALAIGKAAVSVHDSATGRCLFDAHASCVRLDLRTSELTALADTIRRAVARMQNSAPTTPCPPMPLGDAELLDAAREAE